MFGNSRSQPKVDPYQVLGVPRTATEEEIKKAYRKLSLLHHTDRGGDAAKFNEITEAYNMLSEQSLARQQQQQWQQKRADIDVPVSLADFMKGGKSLDLPLSSKERCSCLQDKSKTISCNCPNARGMIGFPCLTCKGRGVIINCKLCDGQGFTVKQLPVKLELVTGQELYTVVVPSTSSAPGVSGATNTSNSITVKVQPQDETKQFSYENTGDNSKLYANDYELDLQLALKSGVHEMTLPDGSVVSIFIPTVNSLYQELLVPGAGVLDGKTGKRGDLVIMPIWTISQRDTFYDLPQDSNIKLAEEIRERPGGQYDNDVQQQQEQMTSGMQAVQCAQQ